MGYGEFVTSHVTISEHGGVVKEPLYVYSLSVFKFLRRGIRGISLATSLVTFVGFSLPSYRDSINSFFLLPPLSESKKIPTTASVLSE
jgi:hypothetical protein